MNAKQQKKLNKQLKKAILKKDLEEVRSALDAGANPDVGVYKGTRIYTRVTTSWMAGLGIFSKDFNNMIGLSIQYSTPEILKALLDAGADPNCNISIPNSGCKSSLDYLPPVFYAIYNDRKDLLKIFLESEKFNHEAVGIFHGFAIYGEQNITPLAYAQKVKNLEAVTMLEDYEEGQKQQTIIEDHRIMELHKKAEELGLNIDDITVSVKKREPVKSKFDVQKFANSVKFNKR